jgi:dipicolinate synthase subunit B
VKETLKRLTGSEIIRTIPEAEPIGPKKLLDLVLVLPATGNTIAKLACGITDTPVLMAIKSHLRNNGPVVIAVSTNDALGNAGQNIGRLFAMRNIYFVPLCQDDPAAKPRSIVFRKGSVIQTVEHALDGVQMQPMLTAGVTAG